MGDMHTNALRNSLRMSGRQDKHLGDEKEGGITAQCINKTAIGADDAVASWTSLGTY